MNQNRDITFPPTSLPKTLFRFTAKRLWTALLVVSFSLALVSRSEARFKAVIDGISVSYSGFGADAYYDPNDGTLTVVVTQSGGKLNILVGPKAYLTWGNFVDVYIAADNATLKSMKIKGNFNCTPFVAGQVNDILRFTLQNGVVGNTEYYGLDFGLGIVSNFIPVSISMKNSYTTAQLFGYANTVARSKSVVQPKSTTTESAGELDLDTTPTPARSVKIDKQSLIRRVQENTH